VDKVPYALPLNPLPTSQSGLPAKIVSGFRGRLCLSTREAEFPERPSRGWGSNIFNPSPQVGKVLRILHRSLKEFRTFAVSDVLQQSEVSALLLQMKLHDNAHRLLMERARTPSVDEFWKLSPGLQYQAVEERTERKRYRRREPAEVTGEGSEEGSSRSGNGSSGNGSMTPRQPPADGADRPGLPERPGDDSPGAQAAWQREFFLRRDSLGKNWDGTLERIGAMSLVKFASLLIELVAGLQFVVESVDLLTRQARFQGPNVCEVPEKDSQPLDVGDQRPYADEKAALTTDGEERGQGREFRRPGLGSQPSRSADDVG
jgi:hypothetical protein